MTFDRMNIWRFPYYINKASLVQIRLQLFKWGHFHIFSLSYNLTSDDLWPWYMIFDLINKWGLPCCIYDPTLVEIHQSMWSQMLTLFTTDNNNNRGQSDPCLSDHFVINCLIDFKNFLLAFTLRNTWSTAQANHKGVEKYIFYCVGDTCAFQNETLKN